MFWKLILIVLTLGGTACGLLVLRQQERDVFATQTVLRREISRLEHDLQAKALRIAELTRLEVLRTYRDEAEASRGVTWRPLPFAPDFRRSAIRPETADEPPAARWNDRSEQPSGELASADDSSNPSGLEPDVRRDDETDRIGS